MASSTHLTQVRPGWLFLLVRRSLRPFLWFVFGARYRGQHHVPATGPVLLAANHISGWDTVFLPPASPRPVQFLAKHTLFTKKGPLGALGKWFLESVGAVPVVRQAGRDAQSALEAGCAVLRDGRVFVVFPEGTRSRDGRLYDGKGGAAFMALDTGAAVVPVGISGTEKLVPFRWWFRPASRITVEFGPVVDFGDVSAMPGAKARREVTNAIIDAIGAITGQERAGHVNATSAESAQS